MSCTRVVCVLLTWEPACCCFQAGIVLGPSGNLGTMLPKQNWWEDYVEETTAGH